MPVGSRLFEDGSTQVEIADDGPWPEVEDLGHSPIKCEVINRARPKAVDHDGEGPSDTYRIGKLDLTPPSKTSGDDVLGDPAGGVGSRAIHLGGVLAREGAPTVPAHATIAVYDDLAAREAGISHRAAHDETARGVHVYRGVLPGDVCLIKNGGDDLPGNVLADLELPDPLVVLGRDDDGADLDGTVILVSDCDLSLAVGAQVGKRRVAADLGKLACEAMRKVDGHRHEDVGLVCGIAEHHALVTCTDPLSLVEIARAGEGAVHALGDIRRLPMDHVDDAAGITVKAILRAVIAYLTQRLSHDGLHINVGLGANLPHDGDGARRGKGLAGDANVTEPCGHPRW